jgi:hypothetical protein
LSILVALLAGFPSDWVGAHRYSLYVKVPVIAASWLLSLLLMPWFAGALLGDRWMTIGRSLRHGWRRVPALVLLPAAAFLPASWLHAFAHRLAIGAPEPLVWALMIGDALVVGLLGTLVGSAMAVAHGRVEGPGNWRAAPASDRYRIEG